MTETVEQKKCPYCHFTQGRTMWVADDYYQSADEFPLADKPFLTSNSRLGWSGKYAITHFYISRHGIIIRISEPENENNATTTGELIGNCPICNRKLGEDDG